ncbi:MAG TPA: DinB family protein [Thermoanaerobaculia bacterium]|nr:DinB family protein [Thermoanaerobaculia bacterium]
MSQDTRDQALRDHLLELLKASSAHLGFDEAIDGLPAELRGKKVPSLAHTVWRLVEHLRIAQEDILEFSRNPTYKAPKWPDDYWPETEAPPSDDAWEQSVEAFRRDLEAMKDLVRDPRTDLFARIPWGEAQTILREAMLVADHNAYHVGQIVTVRQGLGAW